MCDGWKPYPKFTKHIQRCWAHLIRESRDLAERIEEAIPLHKALTQLYEELNDALEGDLSPEVRSELWQESRVTLQQLLMRDYASDKVRKPIGKISNGSDYWFTFIIHPGVEPTNKS